MALVLMHLFAGPSVDHHVAVVLFVVLFPIIECAQRLPIDRDDGRRCLLLIRGDGLRALESVRYGLHDVFMGLNRGDGLGVRHRRTLRPFRHSRSVTAMPSILWLGVFLLALRVSLGCSFAALVGLNSGRAALFRGEIVAHRR